MGETEKRRRGRDGKPLRAPVTSITVDRPQASAASAAAASATAHAGIAARRASVTVASVPTAAATMIEARRAPAAAAASASALPLRRTWRCTGTSEPAKTAADTSHAGLPRTAAGPPARRLTSPARLPALLGERQRPHRPQRRPHRCRQHRRRWPQRSCHRRPGQPPQQRLRPWQRAWSQPWSQPCCWPSRPSAASYLRSSPARRSRRTRTSLIPSSMA